MYTYPFAYPRTSLFFWITFVSVFLLFGANSPLASAQPDRVSLQEPDSLIAHIKNLQQQSEEPIELGLALSGGGAKGFAHIGVLKVLEEAGLTFDYITGTSAGSMVGGLYATGYNAHDLEELSNRTNWTNMFSERSGRRYLANPDKLEDAKYILNLPISKTGISLPEGLISGQNLMELLSKLTWSVHTIEDFSKLPIPFRCVATDLATGDPVVLDSGHLPYAMRASIAIPSIFTPYRLNGKDLIDGGIARNIPVSDARDMGADLVLAVDVSSDLQNPDSLTTIFDIMNQTLSMQIIQSKRPQLDLADMVIRPKLNQYTVGSFNKVEELIAIGEKEARKYLPQLKQIAALLNTGPPPPSIQKPSSVRQIYINELALEGLSNVSEEFVMSQLDFQLPGTLSQQQLLAGIRRLYSSNFFELVTYKILDQNENGSQLVIKVIEQNNDQFRLGFRYDSFDQASLLLHATLRNLLARGSVLRSTVRLGDRLNYNLDYIFYFSGLNPGLGSRLQLDYTRNTYPIFEQNDQIASTDVHTYAIDLFVGDIFSKSVIVGLGARRHWSQLRNMVNPAYFSDEFRAYHKLYALLWLDTYDRANFPTQGQSLRVLGGFATPLLSSSADFFQSSIHWSMAIPMHSSITLRPELYAGLATGSDLPFYEHYYLKYQRPHLGYVDFAGIEPKSISGPSIQKAALTLQIEPFDQRFLNISGNIGNGFDTFPWNPLEETYVKSLELTAGALTPLGPLKLSIATSTRQNIMLELNFGYRF
ncbi:MAG: patatin-like phospholipase family protein [Bacteroidota bacterium]